MGKFIWMLVDLDDNELPLIVADSAKEIAAYCNIPTNSVYETMSRARKDNKKCKFVRIKEGE